MIAPPTTALDTVEATVRDRITRQAEGARLLVVGVTGAQGSGKSTLAAGLVARLTAQGIAAATLSLDDLYKTRAERAALAATVHPLLRTRGVPGTHDVALGLHTIAALERGEEALLPRFDKGADDRAPPALWPRAPHAMRVLVFEGWCLGATPEREAALATPVNALERDEDPDGRWRHFVNAALAGDYAALFGRIDLHIMLAAPDFDVVASWRAQQEAPLQAQGRGMDGPALTRFIAHYERLTRHMLHTLPQTADLVLHLDHDRHVHSVARNEDPAG